MNNILTIISCILSLIIILHTIIFMNVGSVVLTNKNTILQLLIWLCTLFLYYKKGHIGILFIPLLLFILNEFLFINYDIDMYNNYDRTKMFYDITTNHFIYNNNGSQNLTEGIYLNDLYDNNSRMTIEDSKNLTDKEANDRRFDKVMIYLGLDKLDKEELSKISILDMGCGNGDFLLYCSQKGIHCEGLTISSEQVEFIGKQGLKSYEGKYFDKQEQFINKFDIITFFGSLEHMTSGFPGSKAGIEKENKIRKQILNHCKSYFKGDSKYKYIYGTTLHLNPIYCNTINTYIIERAYGGWYHLDSNNQRLFEKAQNEDYTLLMSDDMSWHYYMASIADEDHFGNPDKIKLSNLASILFGIFVNPFLVYMSIYTITGQWMWQFDGKNHTAYEDRNNMNFEEDINKRPTTTWWFLLKHNN